MARFDRGSIGVGDRAEVRRRAELAKIHILAAQLQLDRETYEAVLLRLGSVTSAAKLDPMSRGMVVEYLKRALGAAAHEGHRAQAPHNLGSKPLLAKIEALLADGKKPWAYAEALAKRICKKDRLAFCSSDELRKVVAALSYDQKRRERAQATPRA